MSQGTLHLIQGYFAKAARRLRNAQPDEFVPLIRTGITRMLRDLRSDQLKQMIPLLRDYCVRTFPEQEAPEISKFLRISTGWENETYIFTLTSGPKEQRTAEDLILCIYPGAPAQANTEYQALTRLRAVDYPTPVVKHYAPDGDRLSLFRPFTIMERVEGRRMLKPLLSSTGGEHQRLLSTYCGLLARLHSIDWRILVDDPATYPAGDSLHIVSHYLTTHQTEAAGDMPRGFQSSWQWILSHGEGIVSPGLVIVHNDFHANNIIIRNGANSTGESAVVVDWTNATIADYRFDLAWSLPLLYRYADGSLRSSILREYERQSGRRVENIEFFEAVACYARLWRIYALMTEGAAESGLRPGVEETIRGQLPLIRQIYSRYCELTGLTIPEVEKFLK